MNELDLFGKLLIEKVRDESIEQWQLTLSGKMGGERSRFLYKELSKSFDEIQINLLEEIISQVVDTTIHNMLWTIEQESELKLLINTNQGHVDLVEASDGLTGELYSEDGWILKFSKKLYIEP